MLLDAIELDAQPRKNLMLPKMINIKNPCDVRNLPWQHTIPTPFYASPRTSNIANDGFLDGVACYWTSFG